MEIVSMESEAYNEIIDNIKSLKNILMMHIEAEKEYLPVDWLEANRLCHILNCSRKTMDRLRKQYMLPSSRINNKVYISRSAINELIKERVEKLPIY